MSAEEDESTPTTISFYASRSPTISEIIAETVQEPCECCGVPLIVLTIELPGGTSRMPVEISKIVDSTGKRGKLQSHTPERCHAQRYRDGKTDLAL